ncbi:hypothetical protein [Mycobacterium talmoniae]|uniref:Uncharacterized protein n=1 Tax=Mycobacterium talmoniae TaxID=1858794 RepID=A0A1S1NIN5_9MYCO|nr:hypothetical protein [Mycobacterium talmoniae]OHV03708.1 hypothetical protein BKN37_13630 [Mycobacterium talmoniae]
MPIPPSALHITPSELFLLGRLAFAVTAALALIVVGVLGLRHAQRAGRDGNGWPALSIALSCTAAAWICSLASAPAHDWLGWSEPIPDLTYLAIFSVIELLLILKAVATMISLWEAGICLFASIAWLRAPLEPQSWGPITRLQWALVGWRLDRHEHRLGKTLNTAAHGAEIRLQRVYTPPTDTALHDAGIATWFLITPAPEDLSSLRRIITETPMVRGAVRVPVVDGDVFQARVRVDWKVDALAGLDTDASRRASRWRVISRPTGRNSV